MPIEPLQPEQKLSIEQKVQDLSVSPDIGNTNVVGSQCHGTLIESLSEMSRFANAEESVKNKSLQILSILKDVDVLQAKEAVGIASNHLFWVGQKSQKGLMLVN